MQLLCAVMGLLLSIPFFQRVAMPPQLLVDISKIDLSQEVFNRDSCIKHINNTVTIGITRDGLLAGTRFI